MADKRPKRVCVVCGWKPAVARLRCRTCLAYLTRHGTDRPEELVVERGRKILEEQMTVVREPAKAPRRIDDVGSEAITLEEYRRRAAAGSQ